MPSEEVYNEWLPTGEVPEGEKGLTNHILCLNTKDTVNGRNRAVLKNGKEKVSIGKRFLMKTD